MKTLIPILFLLSMAFPLAPANAAPKKKVIYSEESSTKFVWEWPYHPKRTKTYLQTKPYYATQRLIQRYAGENVSKYRFYYQHKTPYNEWGYYFAPGTRLAPKQVIQFGPVGPNDRVRANASLHY